MQWIAFLSQLEQSRHRHGQGPGVCRGSNRRHRRARRRQSSTARGSTVLQRRSMRDYRGHGKALHRCCRRSIRRRPAPSEAQSVASPCRDPRERWWRRKAAQDPLLDPALTVAAAAGGDRGLRAFSHAVEAYVTKDRTPRSGVGARGWRLSTRATSAPGGAGDIEARGAMLRGSTWPAPPPSCRCSARRMRAPTLTAKWHTRHRYRRHAPTCPLNLAM